MYSKFLLTLINTIRLRQHQQIFFSPLEENTKYEFNKKAILMNVMIRVPCTSALNINRNNKAISYIYARSIWLPWLMGILCAFSSRWRKIYDRFVFSFCESDYVACQLNDNRNCDGWKALKSSSSAINLSQKIFGFDNRKPHLSPGLRTQFPLSGGLMRN